MSYSNYDVLSSVGFARGTMTEEDLENVSFEQLSNICGKNGLDVFTKPRNMTIFTVPVSPNEPFVLVKKDPDANKYSLESYENLSGVPSNYKPFDVVALIKSA